MLQKICMLHIDGATMLEQLNPFMKESLGVIFLSDIDQNLINSIPFFLSQSCSIIKASFLGKDVVLFSEKDIYSIAPEEIINYYSILKKTTNMEVVYISDRKNYFLSRKLFDHKVNFIILNRIISLPSFMMIFQIKNKSYLASENFKFGDYLSPSSQFIMISIFYNYTKDPISSQKIMSFIKEKYSRMTVHRAIKEFVFFGLVEKANSGRNEIFLPPKEKLFSEFIKYMKSPIEREIFVKRSFFEESKEEVVLSGNHAIEFYSRKTNFKLMPSGESSIKRATYRKNFFDDNSPQDQPANLELWSYPPLFNKKFFINHMIADPVSLYLIEKDIRKDVRSLAVLNEILGVYFDWNG